MRATKRETQHRKRNSRRKYTRREQTGKPSEKYSTRKRKKGDNLYAFIHLPTIAAVH